MAAFTNWQIRSSPDVDGPVDRQDSGLCHGRTVLRPAPARYFPTESCRATPRGENDGALGDSGLSDAKKSQSVNLVPTAKERDRRKPELVYHLKVNGLSVELEVGISGPDASRLFRGDDLSFRTMTIRNAQIVRAARGPLDKGAGGPDFLGERTSDPDGTECLELVAKACVIMCSPREFADRIQMMLRRARAVPSEPEEALEAGDLRMWRGKRRVEWRGEALKLTSTEFTLLELLLRHRGRPVSKMELSLHALRRPSARFDRSVDVHVSNLRRKLAQYAKDRCVIQSVYPHQYQLLMENSAS